MQHRCGRTGRAGRKGASVLLVPAAKKRRAELLLKLAGIDVVWGTAPSADEIRKLDQERMLRDALFAEETTSDDLILARALLAERSPEDIAGVAESFAVKIRRPDKEDNIVMRERRSNTPGLAAKTDRDLAGRRVSRRKSDTRASPPTLDNGSLPTRRLRKLHSERRQRRTVAADTCERCGNGHCIHSLRPGQMAGANPAVRPMVRAYGIASLVLS